ncbi:hypothetical protein JCM10207_004632 [Rhodosporidiobolus poonsookiae]
MAAIGLSTFVPPGDPIPQDLILRLTEVNVASLAACFFIFEIVARQAKQYYQRAWAYDSVFWRVVAIVLTVGCAVDLVLLAASVGVSLRDLMHNRYSRDTMDALYIAQKIVLWSTGMLSELFFVLRVQLLTDYKWLVWAMYGLTSAPFAAAFIFFLLYRYKEFHWGFYARIFDLVGGWCNVFFAVFTVVVLGYRIVLQRRSDAKASGDVLSEIFRGAVATSALIALTAGGAAISACFVHDAKAYLLSAFFYNLYPQTAAISALFALEQRQSLRHRSEPARKAPTLQLQRKPTDHPSEWRGDRVSLGPPVEPSKGKSKRRGSQRGGEISFRDVALDTKALEECDPRRSRAGNVWVHEEVVTVEEREDDDEPFMRTKSRRDSDDAV